MSALWFDSMKPLQFIQRDPAKPYAIYYCTLPSFINKFLGSLYFYLFQQMLTFATEARFRDYSGSKERSPYERVHFHSQQQMDTVCENYVPRFFIINRPPTKGSSNLGFFEVSFGRKFQKIEMYFNLKGQVGDQVSQSLFASNMKQKVIERFRSEVEKSRVLFCPTTSLRFPTSNTSAGVKYYDMSAGCYNLAVATTSLNSRLLGKARLTLGKKTMSWFKA